MSFALMHTLLFIYDCCVYILCTTCLCQWVAGCCCIEMIRRRVAFCRLDNFNIRECRRWIRVIIARKRFPLRFHPILDVSYSRRNILVPALSLLPSLYTITSTKQESFICLITKCRWHLYLREHVQLFLACKLIYLRNILQLIS